MKRIVLCVLIVAASLVSGGSRAFGFGGCEEDCAKCHTIQKSEVEQLLVKLQAPNAKVLDIRMSPIRGLWEAVIEDRGVRTPIYIGFSKKFIMGGPVVEVETGMNKTGESLERVNASNPRVADISKIPVENALLLGRADAKYKAVVFTDPDCPYCAKLHAELKKVIADNPEIAFYLKFLPLPMHPDATWKSQSILCSKSLQLLEDNFDRKPIPKPECTTPEIDSNIALAQEIGITGTPTMVMPDGSIVVGIKDAKTIAGLVMQPPKKGATP